MKLNNVRNFKSLLSLNFPSSKGIFSKREESMNSLFPLWIDMYFSQVQVVGGDGFFSSGLSMHTLIDYAHLPPLRQM